MAHARTAPKTTLTDRRKAADAILNGYADAQIAAVLTAAVANGYVYGTAMSGETGGSLDR